MCFLFGHFVITVLLTTGFHLPVRKPGVGLDMDSASVSGTGADAMSGSSACVCFEGAGSAPDLFEVVAILDILTVNHKDRL